MRTIGQGPKQLDNAMALSSNSEAALATVRKVIAERAHLAGPLLPILHGVQEEFGHVPREALPVIAAVLHLSRAEVHGVVSYYHHFREQPAGRCVVQVCRAESCLAMGANALLAHARQSLGCSEISPTSADSAFTVEPVYCLGLCASSPAAMIGTHLHARLTPPRFDAAIAAASAHDGAAVRGAERA